MKRRDLLRYSAALATTPVLSFAQKPREIPAEKAIPRSYFGDGRDWFFQKRYGMFVHWGLYAIPAWHEQHQWRAKMSRKDYVQLAEMWNPVQFNPEQWLDLMEEAGMKYITFTTKHHDGFCLWDTKYTQYNTMNTPYGKDILGMLADACHKRNIPLCLYYSVADWHHPNYPNQGRHHELSGPEPGDEPNWGLYMEFLKNQVKELCTNYGEIHGFWWDMNVPEHKDPSVNAMIRKLQPKAVINNRGFDDGDFGTPERDYDTKAIEAEGFSRPTEACQSVGMESWGFRKNENYYTDKHLIKSIDQFLVRDANYLLNVGPTEEGTIHETSAGILKRIGTWYKSVEESFTGVVPASGLIENKWVSCTRRNKTLYVHLNKDVPGDAVKLRPLRQRPLKATLLNTGTTIETAADMAPSDHSSGMKYLRLENLPANDLCNTVMVIKLEFESEI
ncbi:MAG: alpha-L-fucosidase [Cyclobacteriaceae bacterium]|nr:alpha-L-fucosidase [Cyclobacteriaceae bacterium]